MPTVYADGRSVLHAGDGLQHVSAPPDVCKTPSPGGPVPIPYVNVAADSDLAKGSKSVKVEGESAVLASSNLSASTGDEPGTAGGGVVSAKTKGKLTWSTASADVKFEGKGVVRFMDVTQHNGNSFNLAFTSRGGTGLAYADDFDGPCQICGKGPEPHRVLETPNIAKKATALTRELSRIFRSARSDAARKRVARCAEDGGWSGYMVGVMACKCATPQYFCTNSGSTLPALDDAAAAVGGLTVIHGGPATVNDFVYANQPNRKDVWWRRQMIDEAFRETRGHARNLAGFNTPGTCAGAKLMARCQHAPRIMSETFFSPPGTRWGNRYYVFTTDAAAVVAAAASPDWLERVLANQASVLRPQSYQTGESVASCHTCQMTLFLTNCPERTCP